MFALNIMCVFVLMRSNGVNASRPDCCRTLPGRE